MRHLWVLILGSMATVASGCTSLPTGPSVMVLPAPGKPFEQFQAEDATCRQWAAQQVGPPGTPATQNAAVGAVAGTALGTALGAAIGAESGHVGTGAAIGAGTGLVAGTAVGASADQAYAWNAQRRYDVAYQQCMYAKGNQIPGVMPYTWRLTAPPPPPPPQPGVSPMPPPLPGLPGVPAGSAPPSAAP